MILAPFLFIIFNKIKHHIGHETILILPSYDALAFLYLFKNYANNSFQSHQKNLIFSRPQSSKSVPATTARPLPAKLLNQLYFPLSSHFPKSKPKPIKTVQKPADPKPLRPRTMKQKMEKLNHRPMLIKFPNNLIKQSIKLNKRQGKWPVRQMQQYNTEEIVILSNNQGSESSGGEKEKKSAKEDQEAFQDLSMEQSADRDKFVYQATVSVKLGECYAVIPCSEAELVYTTQEEWLELMGKCFAERQANMSVIGLHSTISLTDSQKEIKEMLWTLILKQFDSKVEKEKNEVQIDPKVASEIENNVAKMLKRLGIKNQSEAQTTMALICSMISTYEAKDQHLGSLKGLEYICNGVCITSPSQQLPQLSAAFEYLMQTQNLKHIFYHGSHLFYSELPILCKEIQNEAPRLFSHLESNQADWAKIFVSYYRTLLLNRLRNPHLIRKIIELVLVYGVAIVRMVLVKIIVDREEEFLRVEDPEKLMGILATNLVLLYFENANNNEKEEKGKEVNPESPESSQQRIIKLMRRLLIGL